MTPPIIPAPLQMPKRPERRTATVAPPADRPDIRREAYRMGMAAAFTTNDITLPEEAARAAYDKAADEIERRCKAEGIDDKGRELAFNSLLLGFTSATMPGNAVQLAFGCIRQHEEHGILPNGPKLLTRGNPMINPRLFWSTIMLGYTDDEFTHTDSETKSKTVCYGQPFPFACTAVATEYTRTFGEAIYPSTVLSFTQNAVLLHLLKLTRKGTKGKHGRPSYYALEENALPGRWGIPDDMLLRQRWAFQQAQVRTGMVWQ